MGANVATKINEVNNTIKNNMTANCRNLSDVNQTIEGITIELEGCSCGDVNLKNSATVNQSCDLDTVAGALADAVQGATTEQMLGLGLGANVSTDIQKNKTDILNTLTAECGSEALIKQRLANNTIKMKSQVVCVGGTLFRRPECIVVPCECNNINVINDSNAGQQCVQSVVQDAVSTMTQQSASKQVIDALPNLGALAMLALSPCIIIIILVVIGMLKPKSASDNMPALEQLEKQGAPQKKKKFNPFGFLGDVDPDDAKQAGKFVKGALGWKGGGSKLFTGDLPIIVVLIFVLVWYGVMTDPRRRRR